MTRATLLVVGLAASCAAAWAPDPVPSPRDDAPAIRPHGAAASSDAPSEIVIESQTATDEFHGVAAASQMADLPSLVTGIIAHVHVVEGQPVKKGDRLVTVNDRVPRARLKAATVQASLTGALKRAQVQLRMAENRLRRIREAVSSGAGASFELQAAEGERDQALASVEQQQDLLKAAEADRQLAEAQLDQYTIFAPFDGVVTELHRRTGAVDPTMKIVTVANLDTLEVELHLPASRFGTIRSGDLLPLKAGVPVNRPVTARVVSVSPVINSASHTFRCLLRIANTSPQLPAGFCVLPDRSEGDRPQISLRRLSPRN